MVRRRHLCVVVWGSGFDADEELCRTPEEADDAVDYINQSLGWEPEMVYVEELDLTSEKKEEIAKMNRPSEWFTGSSGGTHRLIGTGRSRIYI